MLFRVKSNLRKIILLYIFFFISYCFWEVKIAIIEKISRISSLFSKCIFIFVPSQISSKKRHGKKIIGPTSGEGMGLHMGSTGHSNGLVLCLPHG